MKDKNSLFYYSLNYRQRFFRTLMLFPIMLIVIFGAYEIIEDNMITLIIAVVLTLSWIIQLLYNYSKWKKCNK